MKSIVTAMGGRFSREMGIDLSRGEGFGVFAWFLASVLFGARISETIVKHTFQEFEKADVLSPKRILETGWDGLVAILDRGGYVRYDFKTATKLLDIAGTLERHYRGDLNRLHEAAADQRDLEARLEALAKGIGAVTVNIFLREMRGVWPKAAPLPSDLVVTAARNLGIIPQRMVDRERILARLMETWKASGKRAKDFPDLEAALLRVAKNCCRRNACAACRLRSICRTGKMRRR